MWHENDEFWSASFPFMFPASRLAAATGEVGKIIELTGCKAGSVLDLSCGPGRHAVAFAKRGFAVTGVDNTPFLLDKARSYGAEQDAEIEWQLEDMRRFRRPGAFDIALSMFTSFGFFDELADNLAVLDNVFVSLAPNGAFVLDVLGKEVIARTFRATDAEQFDGGMIVQRRKIAAGWDRIEVDWHIIESGHARKFDLQLWIYSGQELKEMLRAAGFSEVSLYGSLDGVPYDEDAKRLIAVAYKR
jgi:SAM-dependent methyltransferase